MTINPVLVVVPRINAVIHAADVNEDKIVGTAIDGDIKVLFTVEMSEVNQQLFVPEANLVVLGKFRLGRDACTVGIAIASIIAVVSLPVAVPSQVADPVEQLAPVAELSKTKRKTSTSRNKKAAKTKVAA